MVDLLTAPTNLLWAAVVSAIVSAGVSYLLRKREARHKLALEYEYSQRRELRTLIGRYHGRIVQATHSFSRRMSNFYGNAGKGWLDAGGRYEKPAYYLSSFVYRFLAIHCLVRQFERQAIFIDQRIAEKSDFEFLNFLTAFGWVMTDVALFDGLEYDDNVQSDHFFGDNLRRYSDLCVDKESQVLTPDAFLQLIAKDRSLDRVFQYFDGLTPEENRPRWDRLVAFHLLLMAFLNTFGYETQHSEDSEFQAVASRLRQPEVLDNLKDWLPRLGLGGKECKRIVKARPRLRGAS